MHPSVIRLLVGFLAAYPVLLVYRKWLRRQELVHQHIYFAVSGISMVWWIMGVQCLFIYLTCIFVHHLTLKCFGGKFWSTAFLFFFQLGFMFFGLLITGYVDGVVNWSVLHCTLCLRLIGIAINVYDGSQPIDQLTGEQQQQALRTIPSLLETLSHCFFIGSCLFGPQHSFANFVKAMKRNHDGGCLDGSLECGMTQLTKGVLISAVFVVGNYYFAPESYLLTEDCRAHWLLWRRVVAYFCIVLYICKLSGPFLMAEGSCMVAGLTFNGCQPDGSIDWHGWTNVNLKYLFLSTPHTASTKGNNIQVNKWASFFVYKRLKFLKSKNTSKFLTMIFLALWHGYQFGYWYFFVSQFFYQWFEADILDLTSKSKIIKSFAERNVVRHIMPLAKLVVINLVFLVDGLLPVRLLHYDKILTATATIYPIFWIVFCLWLIIRNPVRLILIDSTSTTD